MIDSENLKAVIAANIARHRKAAGMTQLELAEKLNYSDKAVSKWEQGDSLPDIVVLKQIADIFGITVDTLIGESGDDFGTDEIAPLPVKRGKKHFIISLLSAGLAWLVATLVFVLLTILDINNAWLAFVYAVPASLIVLLVFNSIWGKTLFSALIVSCLVWSVLLSVVSTVTFSGKWLMLLIGIPLQVLTLLWYAMRIKKD